MKKILYWAFEGNEGTGKTSLSKKFAERCGAVWTYEPNMETDELCFLKKLALNKNDKVSGYARECALLANRIIHQDNNIIPLLGNLNTIVSDRSFLSGMVYAKLKSLSFDTFMEMSKNLNISKYPDVIVFCRNKERKIVKNHADIYDHADQETLDKIDYYYEEALSYIQNKSDTKKISIIEFDNDFSKSLEFNLEKLVKEAAQVCSCTSWKPD